MYIGPAPAFRLWWAAIGTWKSKGSGIPETLEFKKDKDKVLFSRSNQLGNPFEQFEIEVRNNSIGENTILLFHAKLPKQDNDFGGG